MLADREIPKFQHILEQIVSYKQKEVAQRKESLPLTRVKKQFSSPPQNFLHTLRSSSSKPAIIAEVKKASPSKGVIRADFNPVEIAQAYESGGGSCISVLTDEEFFQGSIENLRLVRSSVKLPLLCKEFIIDPYQIYLARVNGADAVLLIAAILSDRTLIDFLEITHYLGMTALVEVHTLAELDRVLALPKVKLIGINNRNLEDFTVDLETTKHLLTQRQEKIKDLDITIVSESGLHTRSDLNFVAQVGARAVLIGESLVKQSDVKQAIKTLLHKEE